ncbi:alpha/beta fold hydrolase [Sphingobium algorifonticola]|nr:alpha/beta fold hydrolase [Sphingobium algorifonticola]
MEQTQHDPLLRTRALAGLQRYQTVERPAPPLPAQVVAQAGSARLLQYGPVLSADRAPVVFVPSLINPPDVLDLSEHASMMRWMAAQGHGVLLVDWGCPSATDPSGKDSDGDLAWHVTARLLPLIAQIRHPSPPVLVGYCLGGTLALAAACLHPVRAMATIAAPWDFDALPQQNRDAIGGLWAQARPMCERLGYVPMEVLQSGFWKLDPARTIAKYADFADLADDGDAMAAFLAVEDWANAGPPLTLAAGRDLFAHLYGENVTGQGRWIVGDRPVNPALPGIPTLSIASTNDHIVPAGTAPPLAERWTRDLGHVGMIVSRRAPELLWRPLSQWLFNHGG